MNLQAILLAIRNLAAAFAVKPMNENEIYLVAKEHLGENLNHNPNVPSEEACAESVSTILAMVGFSIPKGGIAGVLALREWMNNHEFTISKYPRKGAIISSRNKDGSIAHIGVCMEVGIASNNSFTNIQGLIGRFTLNYSYGGWNNSFVIVHGCDLEYHIPA